MKIRTDALLGQHLLAPHRIGHRTHVNIIIRHLYPSPHQYVYHHTMQIIPVGNKIHLDGMGNLGYHKYTDEKE